MYLQNIAEDDGSFIYALPRNRKQRGAIYNPYDLQVVSPNEARSHKVYWTATASNVTMVRAIYLCFPSDVVTIEYGTIQTFQSMSQSKFRNEAANVLVQDSRIKWFPIMKLHLPLFHQDDNIISRIFDSRDKKVWPHQNYLNRPGSVLLVAYFNAVSLAN